MIPHVALGKLLTILSKDHPTLPKDPRTLLKTVTCVKTTELSGGVYHHSGIESGILSQFLVSPELQKLTSVSMQVNVDGLPLFKSSNAQFWPVLGLIEQYVCNVQQNKLPFVIGLYYWKKKPSSLHFLNPFVEEAQRLEAEGVLFERRALPFKISTFICDAPARALVRNVKGHWQMLQSIFSNHLSINTTWTGVGDKACFRDMFLKTIVQRAIRKNPATQDATDEAIQVNVTRYLKGASDREGGKRRRTAERDPQPTP
ncbi:uncharacterized protein LOC113054759 [Carassius auratus]|uniref:Uncharacterized protein LOC113054759 n=1 Tax=Carassius auratus TaxID=7957 RepID=A0A6P6KVJ5_CARAU|nr:uncharacterized protein LOC113054759 [Carassius auratus]